MPLNISFYTQGDDRVVYSSANGNNITQSMGYEWYATHHSTRNHAYAVQTIYDAISILRAIPDNAVGVMHFVGHGAGNKGDFVFIGSANGNDFLASTPAVRYPFNLLQAPSGPDYNQMLLAEIARLVVSNGARIDMQFCWSAQGGLQSAIISALNARRCTNFRVRATRNYFDFRVQAVSNSGNYEIRNVIGNNLPVDLPQSSTARPQH